MGTKHFDCHEENFYEFFNRHPWLCVIGLLFEQRTGRKRRSTSWRDRMKRIFYRTLGNCNGKIYPRAGGIYYRYQIHIGSWFGTYWMPID